MDLIIGIYKVIAKSLYNSLKGFLIYVILLKIFFVFDFNKSITLGCSFILITVLYTCVEIYDKKHKNETLEGKYRKLFENTQYFHIIAIALSVVLSIICSYKTAKLIYIFTFLYFVILTYNVAYKIRQNSPVTEFAQSFFISLLITTIYYDDKRIILGNTLLELAILQFVFCLIYLLITSLSAQYEKYISINKKKNICIINSIFVSILVVLAFFKEKAMNIIVLAFSKTESFFTNVLIYFTRLLNLIFGTLFSGTDKEQEVGEQVVKKTKAAKKILEDKNGKEIAKKLKDVKNIVNMQHVYSAVFVIVAIIIIVVIYLKIKHNRQKKAVNKSYETKEFIFTGKDVLNLLKKNIKQTFTPKEKLSEIRLKYKSTVEEYIYKGYKFYPYYTPNEYNKGVEKVIDKVDEFGDLTQAYNRNRYGEKTK